jgi:hypothetical protein
MRRVHTTYDLLEGHILTGMLRENGVEAWLFDADFVRQDWFKMLAYGGYRIVVADDAVAAARALLQEYRSGQLTQPDADAAVCPHCGQAACIDDPQPRRNVFLAMLILPFVEFGLLAAWHPSHRQIFDWFAVSVVLYTSMPWLLMRYFKWRMRCTQCGHAWRQPPAHGYAQLMRLAEVASTSLP